MEKLEEGEKYVQSYQKKHPKTSSVFIVNFEHISHLLLVFLLLTLTYIRGIIYRQEEKLTVGTYSLGNLFVVYEIRRHVFPTAPSPTTTHFMVCIFYYFLY